MGFIGRGRNPGGSGGERGLSCTQPPKAGLPYGYAGLWGLKYLRRWDIVTGSFLFIYSSFEVILDS